MKKLTLLIVVTSCMFLPFNTTAQMSKKEEKIWKKRVKQLEPEQYKRLLDENRTLEGQVNSMKTELNNLNNQLAEKDEQILSYQSQVGDLRGELSKAQSQATTNTQKSDGIDETKGIIFKVQIGAYSQTDLRRYMNNTRNFSREEENGVRKYTIGVFKDYWDADTFKKYLRQMGVKDAWIVSYRDGQRVPIREVLEGVSKSY